MVGFRVENTQKKLMSVEEFTAYELSASSITPIEQIN
jgi:hypothetical protein